MKNTLHRSNSNKSKLTSGFSGRLLVITGLIVFLIFFGSLIMNPHSCHVSGPKEWVSTDGLRSFAIRTTWNGGCVNHEPIKISFDAAEDGDLRIRVLGPFFNSPGAPDGTPGMPFDKLWDYEAVVEAFFLNDQDQYLEVELSPHGEHLVLMLNGNRNMVKNKLDITFTAAIVDDRWVGEAVIPRSYFPPGVTKFNAYAIHGEGSDRTYEALYPAVGDFDAPDFHRLEFFKDFAMKEILPNYEPNEVSSLWKPYVQQK